MIIKNNSFDNLKNFVEKNNFKNKNSYIPYNKSTYKIIKIIE